MIKFPTKSALICIKMLSVLSNYIWIWLRLRSSCSMPGKLMTGRGAETHQKSYQEIPALC
nr:Uncharacterised protein [Klebsiella pneumoniae]